MVSDSVKIFVCAVQIIHIPDKSFFIFHEYFYTAFQILSNFLTCSEDALKLLEEDWNLRKAMSFPGAKKTVTHTLLIQTETGINVWMLKQCHYFFRQISFYLQLHPLDTKENYVKYLKLLLLHQGNIVLLS